MTESVEILRALEQYYDSQFLRNLRHAVEDFPQTSFAPALSSQQIQSKKWLVSELSNLSLPSEQLIWVLGGWYGVLPAMMFDHSKFSKARIRSFDIDPQCTRIAESMNRSYVMNEWQFKATTMDILNLEYQNGSYQTMRRDGSICEVSESPDFIINTVCEHLPNFDLWWSKIPPNTLIALQSTDFIDDPQHVNCADDLAEFTKQTPMSQVLYSGTLQMTKGKRFMRIGMK